MIQVLPVVRYRPARHTTAESSLNIKPRAAPTSGAGGTLQVLTQQNSTTNGTAIPPSGLAARRQRRR